MYYSARYARIALGRALTTKAENLSPLSQFGGVHGISLKGQKTWRNKPLFRRDGDQRFKTGSEAVEMLLLAAHRKDPHATEFLEILDDILHTLTPLLDRQPKYAWIAKQLLEPERSIQFRVAWLDDMGYSRMNRGWRTQYSSTLGPYEGGLHFSGNLTSSKVKALGLETVFTNSLSGCSLGAASGGADFNPHNKSESETQRFCQSYMTELSKYIGPDMDIPSMGYGVGMPEVGYLYGQYKRINDHVAQKGRGVLWGGLQLYPEAVGHGVVHFANEMLKDKGNTLKGKRCLITGSGKVALSIASKLLEFGAIPLSFSDSNGHIYEPDGFDESKLRTVMRIKSERGARIGRYIISSSTAKFSEPESIFDISADIIFPAAQRSQIDAAQANALADKGCFAVVEGANAPCTRAAITAFRKRGILFGPHMATMASTAIVSGFELSSNPLLPGQSIDKRIETQMASIFRDVNNTAKEFNTRGDLHAGAVISGFIKVADVMLAHGAV